MKVEMKSLHNNQTFDFLKLPKDKRVLNNMWIYKMKHDTNSASMMYKVKLVVIDFG